MILTPQKRAPKLPLTDLSKEAALVWESIVQSHLNKKKQQLTQNTNCHDDYYKTIYERSFLPSNEFNSKVMSVPQKNCNSIGIDHTCINIDQLEGGNDTLTEKLNLTLNSSFNEESNISHGLENTNLKSTYKIEPLRNHSRSANASDHGPNRSSTYFYSQDLSPPLSLSSDEEGLIDSQLQKPASSQTAQPVDCFYNTDLKFLKKNNDYEEVTFKNKTYANKTTSSNKEYEEVASKKKTHANKTTSPSPIKQNRIEFQAGVLEEKSVDGKRRYSDETISAKSVLNLATANFKKPKFSVPSKSNHKPTKRSNGAVQNVLMRNTDKFGPSSCEVNQHAKLSPSSTTELHVAERALTSEVSTRVACTLVRDDLSSLLTSRNTTKSKSASESQKFTGLAFIYSTAKRSIIDNDNLDNFKLLYFKFGRELEPDKRDFMAKIFEECKEIFCFSAKILITTILKEYKFDSTEVSSWRIIDPGVMSWLLDANQDYTTFNNLIKANKFQDEISVHPNSYPDKQLIRHELECLYRVSVKLQTRIEELGLAPLLREIEVPLTTVLSLMECCGLTVDIEFIKKSSSLLKRKLSELEAEAYKLAGHNFVLNSTLQLRQVLFDELKLDSKLSRSVTKTSSGNEKSTSEAVLVSLSEFHPLPGIVLQYRQLQKLKSTYFDGMLTHIRNGQIYTHWCQTSALTGRLASVNPNVQALPKQPVTICFNSYIPDMEGEQVVLNARNVFLPADGYIFLSVDFKQIEFRILAHLTQDKDLLSLFNQDESIDIFTSLTAQWLNKLADDVTLAEREQTKRIVYSVIYGVGRERLASYLKVEALQAKIIMEDFLKKYPCINSFSKSSIEQAKKNGMQTTICNRQRILTDIRHSNFAIRSQAERQAVNFRVQGSAADICKAAMIRVEQLISAQLKNSARLLVQIHDELLFEVKKERLVEASALIKKEMEISGNILFGETKTSLSIPLQVSLSVGEKWGNMEKYTI